VTEFIERLGKAKPPGHIGGELVVAAAQILDEGVSLDDDGCGAVVA